MKETGATFIHPYNNYDIISAQGTAMLELFNQVNDLQGHLDVVISNFYFLQKKFFFVFLIHKKLKIKSSCWWRWIIKWNMYCC